jgi:hypothetical protein
LAALVFGPDPAANMIQADGLGRFASLAVLVAAALALLLSIPKVADFTRRAGPYYALLLLATGNDASRQRLHDDLPRVEILSIASTSSSVLPR